ncbi:predicted protein [Plenodomus lingam JN3]|uniref:Predicted protein n=1 Tax=Leptosphaeria maculans (strain JN3 / isolate v23.1.3 / race Av1-4-5-6-7-8) TaxID=985895 RepID=E5A4T1_LEPMJ|nr:predicted protein [Plenodomus lingam JN3]CBX98629.1 predicted protein [Plenodomus lingam JN3]
MRMFHIVTTLGKKIPLDISEIDETCVLADVEAMYNGRNPDSEDEAEDYFIKSFASVEYPLFDSLSNMFELVCDDVHCPKDLRRKAMASILEKALLVVAKGGVSTISDRYYQSFMFMGSGLSTERAHVAYAELFQAVTEKLYIATGDGSVVSEMLQQTMSDSSWVNSDQLVKLVSKPHSTRNSGRRGCSLGKIVLVAPAARTDIQRCRVFEKAQQILPPVAIPTFIERLFTFNRHSPVTGLDRTFPVQDPTRKHIQYSFNDPNDFKFETQMGRLPHTLVIHKTNNQYMRALQESNKEIDALHTQLQSMRSEFLETILGGNVVTIARVGKSGLMGAATGTAAEAGAEGTGQPPPPASHQPLQPLSASAVNSTTAHPSLPPLYTILKPLQPTSASMPISATPRSTLPPISGGQKPYIIDLTEDEEPDRVAAE